MVCYTDFICGNDNSLDISIGNREENNEKRMNMQWVAYIPFALAIGLAIFAIWTAFFADVEQKTKKKPAPR